MSSSPGGLMSLTESQNSDISVSIIMIHGHRLQPPGISNYFRWDLLNLLLDGGWTTT